MGHSIQEYLKKINSRLSFLDIVSLAATALSFCFLAWYISWLFKTKQQPVVYRTASGAENASIADERPFGSKNGATYTYSWCQGSNRIKPENKIFFESGREAEGLGRTLSKLCAK